MLQRRLFSSFVALLSIAALHCGGKVVVESSTGGGGAGGSPGAGGSVAQGGPTSASGGSPCSAPGGGLDGPCAPTEPSCKAGTSACIALVDNAGASSFALRMSHLTITAPPTLTKGLVKSVIENGVQLNYAKCNLVGGGTFSWLFQLDTVAGTLKTGGALPADDPANGYAFLDQGFKQTSGASFHAAPVTVPVAIGPTCGFNSGAADLVMPIFLDLAGTASLIFPLHQVQFDMGSFSGDHNCIGRYNDQGLDPASGCLEDGNQPTFLDSGLIAAYFSLEEADQVVINAIGQTLCVVLSGDAATFGDGQSPTNACARNGNGHIVFHGDWCSSTSPGQPATPGCHDAVRFEGTFAASGVKLN
ncbi:MAG: hypothetical protein ABJE95_25095 [Byssovorax sp.]